MSGMQRCFKSVGTSLSNVAPKLCQGGKQISRPSQLLLSSKLLQPATSPTVITTREKSFLVKPLTPSVPDNGVSGSLATPSFDDFRLAYSTRTTWELMRALSVFLLCKFPSVADNSLKLMEISYRVLGKRLSEILIRNTVYEQFVAGEDLSELAETIEQLSQNGVGPILFCPLECFPENSGLPLKSFYDLNLEKVQDSIDKAVALEDQNPMVQFKYTAFMSGDLLTYISPWCEETVHNPDVLNVFVAAMEGKTVDFTKLPGWETFNKEKTEELLQGLRRIGKINEDLKKHNVVALVDAEYAYLNPALRLVAIASMMVCNSEGQAKVFYTYQAYFKAKFSELKQDLELSKTLGFSLGVKLVRGAYMVQERTRAQDLAYPDPLNPDFDATSRSYHSCADLLLEEATLALRNLTFTSGGTSKRTSGLTPGVRFIVASHNEDTALHVIKRMDELGIPKHGGGAVYFGQVYGMADHVSFTLGRKGYSVYKSIPYGSIGDTLPYLSRRAQENKAVLANAKRERGLIMKALRDRLLLKS